MGIPGESEGYEDGLRAAIKALDAGIPRWIETDGGEDFRGQSIDKKTGLPVASLTSPPELDEWRIAFARGFNAQVRCALESGGITVNFRPLLLTRTEAVRAFNRNSLGTLSLRNPLIQDPRRRFVIYIVATKHSKKTAAPKSKTRWIGIEHEDGRCDDRFWVYEGPVEFALAKKGQVLIEKGEYYYSAIDVHTLQLLNQFSVKTRKRRKAVKKARRKGMRTVKKAGSQRARK